MGVELQELVRTKLNEFYPDEELINNLVLHLNAAVKRLKLGVISIILIRTKSNILLKGHL